MPTTLLTHATLVTLDDDDRILTDAALAIAGDEIVAVGRPPAGFAADEVIDLGGRVLMPGLYNAHTHAAMTFARGYAEDLPLERWFNERIWRLESALTPEMVYWGTMLAIVEMVRGGVIGFGDHYFHMDQVARAVEETGVRASLAWAVFGTPGEQELGITIPQTLAFVRANDGAANGRLRALFGPHSPYQCPDAFLARTAAVAVRENIGIHIHAAETAEQVLQSLAAHDMTPIAFLAHRGLFETHTILAHAIHASDIDLDILAGESVNVVVCPSTHLKYGLGVARLPEMLNLGINVALGTDGAGSSTALNLWNELRLAVLSQRQAQADATLLGGAAPLHLAGPNGARALGFERAGLLAPGHAADLIVVDTSAAHFQPLHDVVANLVWCTQPADVRDVMVAGRWLMRGRRLLTIDEAQVLAEFRAAVEAMLAAPLAQFRRYNV
jgi:5-methylthioadenosine/S-adenosylhomocysteine deaminase